MLVVNMTQRSACAAYAAESKSTHCARSMLGRMQIGLLVLDACMEQLVLAACAGTSSHAICTPHPRPCTLNPKTHNPEPTSRLDAGTQLHPRAVVVLQLQRPPHRHQGLHGSGIGVRELGQAECSPMPRNLCSLKLGSAWTGLTCCFMDVNKQQRLAIC